MPRPATFAADPERALAQYLRDGVFVEPDVLTPAECDELIAAANRLPSARDGSFLPIMQVHRDEPAFMKTLNHPRIVKIMDQVCGGPVVGVQTQLYYTPPERAGLGFHQDNYFVEAPSDSFASAWVPLVDVTPENGSLYAFLDSHRFGPLPVREVEHEGNDKRQTVYEETILPEPMQKIDISAKRGSAVLIHGYNVHGSYQNHSHENRYVILNTYVRDGAPFRPGHTAKREAVQLTRS
jgi:ectoine hydroxylase-related dioxygenase (phytanoyl-CoA dioxygenase family)